MTYINLHQEDTEIFYFTQGVGYKTKYNLYLNSDLIVMVPPRIVIFTIYYHTDHLGSTQLITDYEGGIYEHIEYTPYGELWIEEKSDYFEKIPFRFTGKEMDEETGFVYFGARYLSSKTGRWLSADPAGAELINPNRKGFHFIESLNCYTYCSNNPIRSMDPNGLFEVLFSDQGKYGNTYTIKNVETGNIVGDAAVGALAIAWNFGANIINTGMNVLGYGMEAADTGYSAVLGGGLTGGGLSGDLTALSMACQALGIEGQLASRTLNTLTNQLKYVSCVDDAAGGGQQLLQAPKMADHHLLPQQFKKWFQSKGINIDDFTVSLPQNTSHLKGVHGNGFNAMPGKWNARWTAFITNNPNATTKNIFQFVGSLMDEFGLSGLSIHGYGK